MDEKRLVYGQDEYIPMVYEEPTYSDTATAADVREGTTVHINGQEVAGELPDVEQATPTISFDSGTITATAEQAAGYVDAGTKSATMELTPIVHAAPTVTLSGKTITATVDYGEGWSVEETKVTTIEQAVQTMPAPEINVYDSGAINVQVPTLYGYYAQNSHGYVKYQDVVSVPTPSIAFDAQSGEVTAENTQARGYTKGGTASSVLSLPVASLAAPSIAIDGPNITATVEQGAGYIGGGVARASAVMPTVSQPAPTISVSANGVITAAETLAQGWTNAELKQATEQLPTIASATITPTKSTQHAISAGYYAIGAVDVAPIPSEYIIPSGTVEINDRGAFDVTIFASANVVLTDFYSANDIALGSIGSIVSGSASIVKDFAFAMNSQIKTATFNNARIVYSGAFYSCTKLTNVNLGNATEILVSAFYGCVSLQFIDLPKVTRIETSAFQGCSNLASISIPRAVSIRDYAFYNCERLLTFDAPALTSIASSCFMFCSGLSSASFPLVSLIMSNAFYSCQNLTTLSFPRLSSYISNTAFRGCVRLERLDLTGVSSVPSLANSNAFQSTPIGGYSDVTGQYGSIYVPASLYSEFTSKTNWSYYSSRMVSV